LSSVDDLKKDLAKLKTVFAAKKGKPEEPAKTKPEPEKKPLLSKPEDEPEIYQDDAEDAEPTEPKNPPAKPQPQFKKKPNPFIKKDKQEPEEEDE